MWAVSEGAAVDYLFAVEGDEDINSGVVVESKRAVGKKLVEGPEQGPVEHHLVKGTKRLNNSG